jgi:lysophospholipase L1-like esterase
MKHSLILIRKIVLLLLFCSIMTTIPAQVFNRNTVVNFLALGDSYTIGESVAEQERWPVHLIRELRAMGYECKDPRIIATTGWRTDDLKKAALAADLKDEYNLVSLLIGVNNQYQGKSVDDYVPEFEELLQMAIKYAQGDKSKVFVVSIPDYGFTPFGKEKQEQISAAIDQFNEKNKSIAKKYGITYINITPISRDGFKDPSLIASDGLHPSGKMYSLWVKKILEALKP